MPEIINVEPVSASENSNEPIKKQRKLGIANLSIAAISFALAVYYLACQLNGENNLNMIVAFVLFTVANCWFGLNRYDTKHFTVDTCMFIATFIALGIIVVEFINV